MLCTLSRKELWFWLCNINGIGQKKIAELLSYFEQPEGIFYAKMNQLEQIKILTNKDREYLATRHDESQVKKLYDQLYKENIEFITYEEDKYPKRLSMLYDPPYSFYLKGTLPKESSLSIAIIGARNCTTYGEEIAVYFARELAKQGVQIISGMAMGIDGCSHTGALEANGYTLAVLGSGINYPYPTSNTRLYHSIEDSGGILSEYGRNIAPKPGNFPKRNRLIAAMSDGVLVVEARRKSGTFITVDQALELGKEIFVIPGRITDELSVGCLDLIKVGAVPIISPDDILEVFHQEILTTSTKDSYQELSVLEQRVIAYLSLEPKHISMLAHETNLEIGELMSILISLELKQVAKEMFKNYYIRNIGYDNMTDKHYL